MDEPAPPPEAHGGPWPPHWALLAAVMVVTGIAGGGLLACLLLRERHPALARRVLAVALLPGLLAWLGFLAWDGPWATAALGHAALSLLAAAGVALLVPLTPPPAPPRPWPGYQHVARAVVLGGMAGLALGCSLGVGFVAAADAAFGSYVPVAFDLGDLLGRAFLVGLVGSMAGMVLGGRLGLRGADASPALVGRWSVGAALSALLLFAVYVPLVHIPTTRAQLWQGAESASLGAGFLATVLLSLGVAGLGPFLGAAAGALSLARRSAAVVALALAYAATWSILTGTTAHHCRVLGEARERAGDVAGAIAWYRRCVARSGDEGDVDAYLRFRLGLLHHRRGDDKAAVEEFVGVVTRLDQRTWYVDAADHYQRRLRRRVGGRRVVLPGLEDKNVGEGQFRDAYCLPDSLGQVLRYWGAPVTDAEIGEALTGIGTGSTLPELVWFAEQRGFRVFLKNQSTVADLRRLVDAGVPALVCVPRHIMMIYGYDESLESLVSYDTSQPGYWIDQWERDFTRSWKGELAPLVVVVPPAAEARIPDALRRDLAAATPSTLHWWLYVYRDAPEDLDHLRRAVALARPQDFAPLASLVRRLECPPPRDDPHLAARLDAGVRFFSSGFEERDGETNRFLQPFRALLRAAGRSDRLLTLLEGLSKRAGLGREGRRELAELLAARGRLARANALLARVSSRPAERFMHATVLEGLGLREAAVEALAEAVEPGRSSDLESPLPEGRRARLAAEALLRLFPWGGARPRVAEALAAHVRAVPYDAAGQVGWALALAEAAAEDGLDPSTAERTLAQIRRALDEARRYGLDAPPLMELIGQVEGSLAQMSSTTATEPTTE